jgi:N6-L-threonylcarbamoyladenine synthase
MIILGVESTCDETSVGIVEDGSRLLANVVASSSEMHQNYGGIVPEVAAREQVRVIVPVLREALHESACTWGDIDAIAVAYGPGLIGSLLIGVETAKILAFVLDKPLIGVNHLVGHVYANWIEKESEIEFPAIGLVVSGGHTDLIYMESHKKLKWISGTLDDAAGEVLDKVARVMGLGYPGGPEIEKAAIKFESHATVGELKTTKTMFSVPMSGSKSFDFSFSGLKTAVVNMYSSQSSNELRTKEIAYAFQETVCRTLVKKTFAVAQKYNVQSVIVGGGVSANGKLREVMLSAGKEFSIKTFFPEKKFSTDNGAMIATAAFYKRKYFDLKKLQANPSLNFI